MLKYRTYLRLNFRKVSKRVEDGKIRGLYRVSGLVRTTAKRSMRLRQGPANAGSPPHAHTRVGLRLIQFHVDRNVSSSIVGPVKFASSNFFNEPVPHVQEFGGIYYNRRRFYNYPERSYMGWTIKKLYREGKIPRGFALNIGVALN